MVKTQIGEFVKDANALRLFEQERVILDVTERICDVMDDKSISRVQLAKMLGKSKGYISQLLDGSANMTLRTLSDVFVSLGLRACVYAKPLHPTKEHQLTLVHDDDPSVKNWDSHWEQAAEQYYPQPALVCAADTDVMAA